MTLKLPWHRELIYKIYICQATLIQNARFTLSEADEASFKGARLHFNTRAEMWGNALHGD